MFEHLAGRKQGLIDSDLYRRYAVLVPYLPETGELLFQVRSHKLRRQPGEICFPGGGVEGGESPLSAAVRETREELLAAEAQVEVLAPLDLLVTSYSSIVHPFLANLHGYRGAFSREEVEAVFRVPFSFFLENEPAVYHNRVTIQPAEDFPYALLGIDAYPWASASSPVLFYECGDRVIWGLTAKIIRNAVELSRQGPGGG